MYASASGHRAPGRSRHRKVESEPGYRYATRPYTIQRPAPVRQTGEPSGGTTAGVHYHPHSPPRNRGRFIERIGSPSVPHGGQPLAHYQVLKSVVRSGTPTPTLVSPRSPSPTPQRSGHQGDASRQALASVRAPQGSAPFIKDVPQPPWPALNAPSGSVVSAPHPTGQNHEQGRLDAPTQSRSPPTPVLYQSGGMHREGSHHTVHHSPSANAYQGTSAAHPARHHSSSHHNNHHRESHHHHHRQQHHSSTARHHHPSTTHHTTHHRSRSGPPNAPSHRYASSHTQPTNGHGRSGTSNAPRTSLDGGYPSRRHHHATSPPPGTADSYYQGNGRSRTSSASSHRSHSHTRVPSPNIPASITQPSHSYSAQKLEKPPPSPPPAANEIHHAHQSHPLAASELCRNPHRPALPANYDGQMETRYVNMLLAMDGISPLYYALSSFFTWILLAGFVLLPGTFASLQNKPAGSPASGILNFINHLGLYVVAFVCTGIGACGMIWLWWRWHGNYVWVSNRIFLPGFLNSSAGLISTLSSIYAIQGGVFGRTEQSAIFVTGSLSVICGILVLVYEFWLIRNLKLEHDHEVGVELAGKYGEGVLGEKRDENGEA